MSLAFKKQKAPTQKDLKKYEKLKSEIESSNENAEVKAFKLNLLEDIGWAGYTSWFKDRMVFLRSGWFVVYVPNAWTKEAIKRSYNRTLTKLKVILHVEE